MSPTESFIHGLDEKVNKYTLHIYQQSYSIHLKLSTKVTNLKQFDSYSVDIVFPCTNILWMSNNIITTRLIMVL